MALLNPYTALGIAIIYIAYNYVSDQLFWQSLRKFAKSKGATLPKHAPSVLPGYLEYAWRVFRAPQRNEDIFDVLGEKYAREGETFTTPLILSNKRNLHTIDPVNIKALYSTQFEEFGRGPQLNNKMFLGTSFFTMDGAFWEHSRDMFTPQFERANIVDLGITEAAVQDLLHAVDTLGLTIATGGNQNKVVELNLRPMIFCFTLDTSTEFLFGESLGSQIAQLKPGHKTTTFTEAISTAQHWITRRVRIGALANLLVPDKEGKAAVKLVHNYVEGFVKKALVAADNKTSETGKYCVLNALAETCRDALELRDQTLSLMLAGRETTASMISWTFVHLARNPHVYQKLRREVLEHFGGPETGGEKMTFETLKRCNYLTHCMYESLRLTDVAPMMARFALKNTTLPRGGGPDGNLPIAIHKGQFIMFSTHMMHRRKDIYGPDAEEYHPERWIGRKMDGTTFVPFAAGPRTCLGQQYALTEAGYLIARLVQTWEKIEWLGPKDKLEKEVIFTMRPKRIPLRCTWAGVDGNREKS